MGVVGKLILSGVVAQFFLWVYYDRYFKYLDCFNEEGRCFDPLEMTVNTTSNFVWIIPSLFFFGLFLRYLFILILMKRN